MKLSILVIAFCTTMPTFTASFHLPNDRETSHLNRTQNATGHTRVKRGFSVTISKGFEKSKKPVQIILMKPNFLTDLIMLKKNLLKKVVMTVMGLVGKIVSAKAMKPMPMGMQKQMPVTADRNVVVSNPSSTGPLTTPLGITQSAGVSQPWTTVNSDPARSSTTIPKGEMESTSAATMSWTTSSGLLQNVANALSQRDAVPPPTRGGGWAMASHTPNGGMMMIMPSGSSAYDPMAQAVLTMMMNHPSSSRAWRGGVPTWPVTETRPNTEPPVIMYAVTRKPYVPKFNTSNPYYNDIKTNLIDERSSVKSQATTPSSSTTATVVENPTKPVPSYVSPSSTAPVKSATIPPNEDSVNATVVLLTENKTNPVSPSVPA